MSGTPLAVIGRFRFASNQAELERLQARTTQSLRERFDCIREEKGVLYARASWQKLVGISVGHPLAAFPALSVSITLEGETIRFEYCAPMAWAVLVAAIWAVGAAAMIGVGRDFLTSLAITGAAALIAFIAGLVRGERTLDAWARSLVAPADPPPAA